ncbi:hypothetical protein L2E82_05267 [Cichorium intybus]|uniref:Uncharacterized protein n=1 Tax=Cichorium intybus TaxID=13427 RepID=A0ACB9H8K2_CICIN|nr:hypothetical protein L2E82_05267 [Cichorium intybus]
MESRSQEREHTQIKKKSILVCACSLISASKQKIESRRKLSRLDFGFEGCDFQKLAIEVDPIFASLKQSKSTIPNRGFRSPNQLCTCRLQ